MSNNKTYGIELARQQFFKDLQEDRDFIIFRERATITYGHHPSYGVLVAGTNTYVLNNLGPRSEALVNQFFKQFKYINDVRTV